MSEILRFHPREVEPATLNKPEATTNSYEAPSDLDQKIQAELQRVTQLLKKAQLLCEKILEEQSLS
jgi:hypothetical protein